MSILGKQPSHVHHSTGAARNSAIHVLITGASRGIGAALALRYAAPGVRLTLIARDAEKLQSSADAAASRGAVVSIIIADVRDGDSLDALISVADREAPIDVLIANAGVGGAGTMAGSKGEDPAMARVVSSVNFGGVVNTVAPIVPAMIQRRKGHIVIISSAAAFAPLPLAPTYAASKSGIAAYAKSLRLLVAAQGVRVTLVSPGFVDTEMSADVGPRPFLIGPDELANAIHEAVQRGARHLVYPWQFRFAPILAALIPEFAFKLLLSRWMRAK